MRFVTRRACCIELHYLSLSRYPHNSRLHCNRHLFSISVRIWKYFSLFLLALYDKARYLIAIYRVLYLSASVRYLTRYLKHCSNFKKWLLIRIIITVNTALFLSRKYAKFNHGTRRHHYPRMLARLLPENPYFLICRHGGSSNWKK